MIKALLIGLLCGLLAMPVMATDYYVGQSPAGSGNGSSCANQDAYNGSYITTSGNFVPGITWHMCGTVNPGPGGTCFTNLGNGTSGSPITLIFETNAVCEATYFGVNGYDSCPSGPCPAAISDVGYNYFIIDGGTNGIIETTANGTDLANHKNSIGIEVGGTTTGTIIRNLTIGPLYVNDTSHVYPGDSGSGSTCPAGQNGGVIGCDQVVIPDSGTGGASDSGVIGIRVASASSLSICNVTISASGQAIQIATADNSNTPNLNCASNTFSAGVNVFNVNISNSYRWISLGNIGSTAATLAVYNSNLSGNDSNYLYPTNSLHTSGFSSFVGTQLVTVYLYNMAITASFANHETSGPICCTPATSSTGGCDLRAFNDLVLGGYTNGTALSSHSNGTFILNSTFIGAPGSGISGFAQLWGDNNPTSGYGNTYQIANDIILLDTSTSGPDYFYNSVDGYTMHLNQISNWAGNVYYPATTGSYNSQWIWVLSSPQTSLTAWQSFCSCDTGSVLASPNLNSSYQPNVGSPAIGIGTNLSSLAQANGGSWPNAILYDKPVTVGVGGSLFGVARPTSGAWTAGAYNQASAALPTIINPTIIAEEK